MLVRSVQLSDLQRNGSLSAAVSSALTEACHEADRRGSVKVTTRHLLYSLVRTVHGQELLSIPGINGDLLDQRIEELLSQQSALIVFLQRKIDTAKQQISVWEKREHTWRKYENHDRGIRSNAHQRDLGYRIGKARK